MVVGIGPERAYKFSIRSLVSALREVEGVVLAGGFWQERDAVSVNTENTGHVVVCSCRGWGVTAQMRTQRPRK